MGDVRPARPSRQPAVGRFREARLARRAEDLAIRQRPFLEAAERVMALVKENRALIDGYRETRLDTAEALRRSLSDGASSLRHGARSEMARNGARRIAFGEEGRSDRTAFVAKLREDVARIVSEDFR